jgi:Lon-like ATP-dependent protease
VRTEIHDGERGQGGSETGDGTAALLGGLDIESTADVVVPERLLDRVIGQERAREAIERAVTGRRHVLLVGRPGTGKSMLARAMSELLPAEGLADVLVYANPADETRPRVRTLPAGQGSKLLAGHRKRLRSRARTGATVRRLLLALVFLYAVLVAAEPLYGVVAVSLLWLLFRTGRRRLNVGTPKLLVNNAERDRAPFEDATGTHAGALLGDVRHDPYQSGGLETPSHDRVESGAIHRANGGVLFLDEVATLDRRSQQQLLTALQERRFAITGQAENSAGALVRTDPVPTDFVLVAAGNEDALERLHPALRSRIRGYGYEVYMDDTIADTPENRRALVRFVAQEVATDGRLPHFTREGAAAVVLEARRRADRRGRLTLELRDLGGLVRVAGDLARAEGADRVGRDHVLRARRRSRSIEGQLIAHHLDRRRDYGLAAVDGAAVGRANGLAVLGADAGVVLPIVAGVAPAQDEGRVIATGDVDPEAIQHVAAVVKRHAGGALAGRDVHLQLLGPADATDDGTTLAAVVAALSALADAPVDGSIGLIGGLSVRGDVLPVRDVTTRLEAATAAGLRRVVLPASNRADLPAATDRAAAVGGEVGVGVEVEAEVVPVAHVGEALAAAIVRGDGTGDAGEVDSASLVGRLLGAARSVDPTVPSAERTPDGVEASTPDGCD